MGALHSRITENSIAAAKTTNTRARERILNASWHTKPGHGNRVVGFFLNSSLIE
jgi:hypothetical protein